VGWPASAHPGPAAARESGFDTSLLEVLSDVDVPEDLFSAEAVPTSGTSLSVIVPTLNEELRLAGCPDWPVMEDLHLVRQLKRLAPVPTAPEATRHRANGWTLRTFLRHQLMLAAYHPGAPAKFIARLRP
jgi:hypothetical protein